MVWRVGPHSKEFAMKAFHMLLHEIAFDWNGEMDTVFSCCWVHMSVYDSVSASFIGKILHVPNEDGNENDPYAVAV